jgi:hypothetical protein
MRIEFLGAFTLRGSVEKRIVTATLRGESGLAGCVFSSSMIDLIPTRLARQAWPPATNEPEQ